MYNKETDKMNLVVEKIEQLVSSIKEKNYDFAKYFADNNFIDGFILTLVNIEIEKMKQDKMKKIVKEIINDEKKKYFEKLVINENKCFDECFENSIRVINFNNYYILWLCGISSLDVNYVFDKNGNLLFDNINIAGIDKNNFFVFSYDVKEMKDKLYHYQVNDSEINLVKVLDDVVDIDYCDFFVRDLVVCSCNEGSMLYNYKTKEVLIPSFSSMFKDVKNNELVRVVKKIYGIYDYRSSLVSKLEFLVDRNGEISSPVCDFETGYECNHLLSSYGDIQEEILNNVYKDASKMSKIYKRVKKQN